MSPELAGLFLPLAPILAGFLLNGLSETIASRKTSPSVGGNSRADGGIFG